MFNFNNNNGVNSSNSCTSTSSNHHVPRINSLMSRMLASSHTLPSSSSSSNIANSFNSSNENVLVTSSSNQATDQSNAGVNNLNARRNLFGIRLNHEQLKQDLNEMWKDQIELQKMRWNFDFEKLKPIQNNSTIRTQQQQQQQQQQQHLAQENQCSNQTSNSSNRYEWTKLTFYTPNNQLEEMNDKPSLIRTCFDQNELLNANTKKTNVAFGASRSNSESYDDGDDDCVEESEEEDEALAIPQFYKYQRRFKLHEEKNYLKMKLAVAAAAVAASAACQSVTSTQQATKSTNDIISNNETKNKKTIKRASSSTKTNKINKKIMKSKREQSNENKFQPIFRIEAMNSSKLPETIDTINKPTVSSKKKTTKTTRKSINLKNTSTVKKPKVVRPRTRQTSLALSPSTQNLIITFSENRKDTLRSACINNKKQEKSIESSKQAPLVNKISLESSSKSAFKPSTSSQKSVNNSNTDNNTASNNVSPTSMKQQTLLDLLKQRKRRNTVNSKETKLISSNNNSVSHNLRSLSSNTATAE